MIVIDASAIVGYVLNRENNSSLAELLSRQQVLVAPTLIEYEFGSAIRRINLAGKLTAQAAKEVFTEFDQLRIDLHPAADLKARAWQLRHNFSFYDACYVALAELLQVPLCTVDRRLAAAMGHQAEILMF